MPTAEETGMIEDISGRIANAAIKELFVKYCREVLLFSEDISPELTPFEIRFNGPSGFRAVVSPYRELFRVSIGAAGACDIRVSAKGGLISALDMSLNHFLECIEREDS